MSLHSKPPTIDISTKNQIFYSEPPNYDQAVFEREWSTKLMMDVYDGFLSTAEIEQLLASKNIWMHSDEVELRLRIRSEEYEKRNNGRQT